MYHEEVLRLVLSRFPLVLIDRYPPCLNLSYVACARYSAAYRAINLLKRHGHQQMGFIGQLACHANSISKRRGAFDQAMHESDAAYPSAYKLNLRGGGKDFEEQFKTYMIN